MYKGSKDKPKRSYKRQVNGDGVSEEDKKKIWNEKWLLLEFDIPTNKMDYYISNYGRSKSVDKETGKINYPKGVILKQCNLRLLRIKLSNGTSPGIYIHKFVAENFVDKTSADQNCIMHLDGDKMNNNWRNLKWCTKSELFDFQRKLGWYDKKTNCKLTETQVISLKKKLKRGKTKKKILARQLGISLTQLKRIESGENWGEIKID